MGEGAARVMESYGIKAVRGVSGEIRAAVDAYVTGRVKDSGSNCAGHAHGDGHDCSHH
jgi:predicted Fe-Mo cluster-binding NifX family protein